MFEKRIGQAQKLVQVVEERLWIPLKVWLRSEGGNLYHFPYGYEVHMSEEVKQFLVKFRDSTSIFIRFIPDYVLGLERKERKVVYLLEYKSMTTPRWTEGDNQWNVGQVEADAWENYMRLIDIGINVVLFVYCSYHRRPLLMDFPRHDFIYRKRQETKYTETGSGTPYYNIDLMKIRSVDRFLEEEFSIPCEVFMPYLLDTLKAIGSEELLQTRHDKRSKYKNVKIEWEIPKCKGLY